MDGGGAYTFILKNCEESLGNKDPCLKIRDLKNALTL